jgi:competence protein ComEC
LGLPGEFDFQRYLSFRSVAAIGRVATPDDIVLIRGAAQDSLLRRIDLVSARLGDFIRSTVHDESISSVLTALLIGDQKRIPTELSDAYTRAGVNHILSISGFHIGIIAYFIVLVTLLLATRSEYIAVHVNLRRSAVLLSLPAMLLYLVITGTAPATARSVIMLAAIVLALYGERESEPVNVLLTAAFLLVSVYPPTLFDISFQLSFLALWGIIIFVPLITDLFGKIKQTWLRTLIQFVASSCAATSVTIIPVLFVFNVATINGILTNFLIVPLLGYGAVLAGFCALPLVYVYSPGAELLLWVAARIVELSNWIVIMFAGLPVYRFHAVTSLDMLLFLIFMCSMTFVRFGRLKLLLCVLLPAVAIITHIAAPSGGDGRLHISMLSVGQAESLLIRFPDGSTMLVDGGGYLHDTGRDFGERVLAPALFKLGVQAIDYLVLTHSHPDHIGGLTYLARSMPVGTFLEAAPGGFGETYSQLLAILGQTHTAVRQLAVGDEMTLPGNVRLQVLSPRRDVRRNGVSVDEMSLNDNSLVFRLIYGAFSMMFTADAGFSTEEQLISTGADIRSTILKVGHHGSRYSTSEMFLQRVNPKAALISAGSGNSFGLPSPVTIRQLEMNGIQTYRTDRDGTIELVCDGASWNISTPYRSN